MKIGNSTVQFNTMNVNTYTLHYNSEEFQSQVENLALEFEKEYPGGDWSTYINQASWTIIHEINKPERLRLVKYWQVVRTKYDHTTDTLPGPLTYDELVRWLTGRDASVRRSLVAYPRAHKERKYTLEEFVKMFNSDECNDFWNNYGLINEEQTIRLFKLEDIE